MKFDELSNEVFSDYQIMVNSFNELSEVIPVGPDDQAWLFTRRARRRLALAS